MAHEGMDADNYLILIRDMLKLPSGSSELDILKAALEAVTKYTETENERLRLRQMIRDELGFEDDF